MKGANGRPIRFGALLRQADNRWASVADACRIADDLGFHAIHFIDHLLAIPDPTGDILESWTTMTACAMLTRRVRLSANVLCNSFRSPALLAKRCIDRIREKIVQGITYFVCVFTDGGQPETVRLFGERVLPAFR